MNDKDATIRIGLDVGGTFTDLFLLDEANGNVIRHKLSSTPEQPHIAPIQGIREALAKAGATAAQVKFVGLGTTVATNALIERKGAMTGLITTEGFRDLLEIARQKRPNAYDLFARKAKPLISRELCLAVGERMSAEGDVIEPLNEDEVLQAMSDLAGQGVTSVAICFLNSYANPEHERRAAQLLRDRWPGISVTASHELSPEFREYERMSSTVVNAYLMPVMRDYLSQLTSEAKAIGIADTPFVMASGGGIVTPALASQRPIDILLSGPSGGVSAAIYLAQASGYSDLITFDMGGTSTEACVIQEGGASVTHTREIQGLPIKSAAVDVHTVGSGGSSIAWIDAGGMLRVGPHSAGSKPGPACYGNPGARLPTMTDANVVLGRLNQEYLLDGAMRIDASLSFQAIEEHIAGPKGLAVHDAAVAMLAISNASIAQAIRFVSVGHGLDPSHFMLVAFGGAGPLHAADVARELNMSVLVPPGPGVLCAMGVLTKDTELDLSQTRLLRGLGEQSAVDEVARIYADLDRRACEVFALNGVDMNGLVIERTVDARYVGQSFELSVPVAAGGVQASTLAAVRQDFNEVHKRRYGYDKPHEEVELVTFRIKASAPVPRKPNLAVAQTVSVDEKPVPVMTRRAYFEPVQGIVDCPVFRRTQLAAGASIPGPAIIEQMDTTTIIPPDFQAHVDEWGNLILRRFEGN